MKIILDTPKRVIITPAVAEVSKLITEFELVEIKDNGESVKAIVVVNDVASVIVLWEGAEYGEIGDWTQAQANAKIIEKL